MAAAAAHASSGHRMVGRAPADARSYSMTPVDHLCALLRGAVAGNAHDQAHAAVYAITTLQGASYAILTATGIEVSGATAFNEFLRELL